MTDYNPADHTVEEVETYVSENPASAQAVLEAEQARGDDSRKTLVASLEKTVGDQQEAPVAAEPKPVTVAPNPTPTTLLGKEYEVTPERGYRVKG